MTEDRQRHIDTLRRVERLASNTDLIDALIAAISALEREGQMEAVIAAMREALEASVEIIELHTTEGDEIAQGVVVAARSALSNTAQLATDHDAAVRTDERRKVLKDVAAIATLWGYPTLVQVIRQLAAQPEESING